MAAATTTASRSGTGGTPATTGVTPRLIMGTAGRAATNIAAAGAGSRLMDDHSLVKLLFLIIGLVKLYNMMMTAASLLGY